MTTSAPLVALLLVVPACSRPTSVEHGPDAEVVSSPATSTAIAAAFADAAPASVASVASLASAPCTFTLPAAPASLAKVGAAELARAIIPALDVTTMKAKLKTEPPASGRVVDCLDEPADSVWEEHAAPMPGKGHVEVALRQPLSGGRELVWAMTGYPLAACASEDGFVALVHLDGAVVVADAVGVWTQECGTPKKMRVAKLAGQEVYAEDSAFGSGAQTSTTETLWMVQGKRLVSIGGYDVAGDAAGLEDENHWLYSMDGSAQFAGDTVTVHETWTWTSSLAADGGGPKPRTAVNLRKFVLEGGKLRALSPDGAPPVPR